MDTIEIYSSYNNTILLIDNLTNESRFNGIMFNQETTIFNQVAVKPWPRTFGLFFYRAA